MPLKILCSGFLVRYPVGGFSWHHLQYLVGFQRLGHEVLYVEDSGWQNSCYDPSLNQMTGDSSYGRQYLSELLRPHGLENHWCYLGENGLSHGRSRTELAQFCNECDVYFNLSNINCIPETQDCRRRVLVDTDPVFTQIKAHGLGGAFSDYHRLFTYGENVNQDGCTMPTGVARWFPTRQPVVLDLWLAGPGLSAAPYTTVMNWSAYGEHEYNGRIYGQKDREFEPYFDLPLRTGERLELAINAPQGVRERLLAGGWRVSDPLRVARTPVDYQAYLRLSRGEFSVAKHAYVMTRSGWFSDRSTGYLASGRPVILQDTGFSEVLPTGKGLLAFRTPQEAVDALCRVSADFEEHCSAARAIAEQYFDAKRVLTDLLEKSLA